MCFSASASFTLAGVLLPAGVYCVHAAFARNRAFLCLAVIPLIFSFQQAAEGVVWLALDDQAAGLTRTASLVFLVFALAFWPFWIPCCAYLLETNATKRWVLGVITLLGLLGGLVLFVPLALVPEYLQTRPMHHSIFYDMDRSPVFRWLPLAAWEILYVAVVAMPPLLSRTTGFFLFSVGIVLSATISHVFFWYASASVWCFFAATLSLYLCWCFRDLPMVGTSELCRGQPTG